MKNQDDAPKKEDEKPAVAPKVNVQMLIKLQEKPEVARDLQRFSGFRNFKESDLKLRVR